MSTTISGTYNRGVTAIVRVISYHMQCIVYRFRLRAIQAEESKNYIRRMYYIIYFYNTYALHVHRITTRASPAIIIVLTDIIFKLSRG